MFLAGKVTLQLAGEITVDFHTLLQKQFFYWNRELLIFKLINVKRDDYVKQYSNVSNMRKICEEGVGPRLHVVYLYNFKGTCVK